MIKHNELSSAELNDRLKFLKDLLYNTPPSKVHERIVNEKRECEEVLKCR